MGVYRGYIVICKEEHSYYDVHFLLVSCNYSGI